MEQYLRWRFTDKLKTQYRLLYDEWRKNITEEQMAYFREEMHRAIMLGIYKEL